jgi:hypothetical protein
MGSMWENCPSDMCSSQVFPYPPPRILTPTHAGPPTKYHIYTPGQPNAYVRTGLYKEGILGDLEIQFSGEVGFWVTWIIHLSNVSPGLVSPGSMLPLDTWFGSMVWLVGYVDPPIRPSTLPRIQGPGSKVWI